MWFLLDAQSGKTGLVLPASQLAFVHLVTDLHPWSSVPEQPGSACGGQQITPCCFAQGSGLSPEGHLATGEA